MSTLLNKSYLVKVSTKGGGGVKNAPNSVYMVCTQPLSNSPGGLDSLILTKKNL